MSADLLMSTVLAGRSLRHRDYGYEGAAFRLGSVLDVSVDECKQRVILAHPDIAAGMPLGAALAHENIAGDGALAAEQLHAKSPARRVAAVARRSACLLVSHGLSPRPVSYTDSATESPHFFLPLVAGLVLEGLKRLAGFLACALAFALGADFGLA